MVVGMGKSEWETIGYVIAEKVTCPLPAGIYDVGSKKYSPELFTK